jgi:hypothetical protein
MMIMSKTNHASNLSHDTPNDHRAVADSELDAVSGGWSLNGIPGATAPTETTQWNWRKFVDAPPLKGTGL